MILPDFGVRFVSVIKRTGALGLVAGIVGFTGSSDLTAQQITALGDEGWGDQSGSTGNSFGDYSYEFTESGPLGENAVRLVATGTGEQAALATLEQFSGLKIAEFDGLDYSIESVLGTYSAWAETAAAGSMPNLKISLYISDTSYTASQVVDRLDTEDLEWAKTLVYLPGGSTPTSGSWESFDVSSADWWWTGASQAHQSFDSWIPDVFDYVDGLPTPAYLYIGSIQFGLGGSSNENLLTGYVDEMDVSFGSAGSFTYDFGASAVPEPAHFALGLSMLALASGVMRRNRLRPEY